MDSITQTPTEPLDYAAISATYSALVGLLVLAVRSGRTDEVIPGTELVPLGAATFALAKLIGQEKVETWIRAPFVEEPTEGERTPRGRGLRYAVGELLTCTRCLGAWSALGLVALRLASPSTGRTVTTVLAASAANDFLQTGFALARAKANEVG